MCENPHHSTRYQNVAERRRDISYLEKLITDYVGVYPIVMITVCHEVAKDYFLARARMCVKRTYLGRRYM